MSCDADFIARLYRFLAPVSIAGDPGVTCSILKSEDDGVRGVVQDVADFRPQGESMQFRRKGFERLRQVRGICDCRFGGKRRKGHCSSRQ